MRAPVIGLTGLKGSGKSTAAEYLVAAHDFIRISFASPLKKMMETLLAYRGVSQVMIREMLYGSGKEVPHPALEGRSPRHALQTLGTEWGRDLIGSDLWIHSWFDATWQVFKKGQSVVVDDVRFNNEVSAILNFNGKIFRIVRSETQLVRSETQQIDSHVSEDELILKSFPKIQNFGTVAELHQALDKIGYDL